FTPSHDYALQTLKEIPYARWREYNPEDAVPFTIARSTCLVATRYLRMYARLTPSTQQKYWDHGRSRTLLTITRPTFRPRNSCGWGGSQRKASIFPSAKSSIGFGEVLVTQLMSLVGSSPTWAVIMLRQTCSSR